MIVCGSIYENLYFKPYFTELADFKRLYQGLVLPNSNGWSFKSYLGVDQYQIKGGLYYGTQTAAATIAHDNETAALKALKMGVVATSGQIVNVSQGIFVSSVKNLTADPRGYICNHIPQPFGLYPHESDQERILTGVNGEYDFITGLFHGQLDFITLGDIWNV